MATNVTTQEIKNVIFEIYWVKHECLNHICSKSVLSWLKSSFDGCKVFISFRESIAVPVVTDYIKPDVNLDAPLGMTVDTVVDHSLKKLRPP